MAYRLSLPKLQETFQHFRNCGEGKRECVVWWLSRWDEPSEICVAVHPPHLGHFGGFEVDSNWITQFWSELARLNLGVRVQAHTHPKKAFHSATDDAWPVIHTAGFLSLVIPNFGLGPVGFAQAFLAEIDTNGVWHRVEAESRLQVVP
jgi:hypothetical protein